MAGTAIPMTRAVKREPRIACLRTPLSPCLSTGVLRPPPNLNTAMERIPEAELAGYLARVPQWTREGIEIARAFTFRNFREAMGFVVQVALLAERADHHPDIDIRYKQVTLRLSTHSAGGLTEKDFALAQQIDQLV
jgi:4a-hydroxytetrahydrobiopterin dehydratase